MAAVSEKAKANVKRGKQEWYQWYKDHGLCPRCHERSPDGGRVLCPKCLEKERKKKRDRKAYYQARRQSFIDAGMCDICGKRPPTEGLLTCPVCRQNRQDSRIKWKIIRKIDKEVQEARNGKHNHIA